MSLPPVLEPSGLPAFLANGHDGDFDDIYSIDPRGTGHYRKRRVATVAPRRVSVSRILTPAQMLAYDEWFESTIVVGETHFSAWVSAQGPGQLYFDACWVAPYESVPMATPLGIFWRITGQLVLSGDGQIERPLDGALEVEYVARLIGSAQVEADGALAVEYEAELLPVTSLLVEYEAELIAVTPYYLLIGDGFYLDIGSGYRLRIG